MRYGWFFVCQPVIPKKDCLSIDDLLRVSFLHLSFYCKFALQLLVKPVFGFCLKRMSHSCGMYFKYYNSIWTNKESQKNRLFKHSIEPDLIISIFKDIQTCVHVGATFSGVKNLKEKKCVNQFLTFRSKFQVENCWHSQLVSIHFQRMYITFSFFACSS